MHMISDIDQKSVHGGKGSNNTEISEKSTTQRAAPFEAFLVADQKNSSFNELLDLTATGCCD